MDQRKSEDKDFFKDVVDNLYDGVYFVDRDRVITYWNKGAERIAGYSADKTVGRSCRDKLLNHVTANGMELCTKNCPLTAVMKDGNPREAEVFLHHKEGHRVPVIVRGTPLRDTQGNIVGAIETFSNNSNLIKARREVRKSRQAALTDPLTGIGNRRYVAGRLGAAIAEFGVVKNPTGLVFFDIDNFRTFNNTYGHNTGDKVLCMVTSTLRNAVRTSDTIGRWGGEEFIAILYDVQDTEKSLHAVGEKIRSLIERSRLDLDDQSLSVTVSVGATFLQAGDTPESFLERADKLMYASKQAGRNRVSIG